MEDTTNKMQHLRLLDKMMQFNNTLEDKLELIKNQAPKKHDEIMKHIYECYQNKLENIEILVNIMTRISESFPNNHTDDLMLEVASKIINVDGGK